MNRATLHIITGLIFSCFLNYQGKAQIDYPAGKNRSDLPQEKICLNTDRNIFVTGEYIYYSAFVSGSLKNQENSISKVLYVELFNPDKTPVIRQKIPIVKGKAEGSIHLSEDIRTGRYYLRAFTQYTRNFLPAAYAIENIDVINPDLPAQTTQSPDTEAVKIFPAYGNIYQGVKNKIAFSTTERKNDKIDSILVLQDKHNLTSETDFYFEDRYGHFMLTPDVNSTYSLKAYFSSGDSIMTLLKVMPISDLVIAHSENDKKIFFELKGALFTTNKIGLNVYSATGILLKQFSYIFTENSRLEIDKSSLESGMNYFIFETDEQKLIQNTPVWKAYPEPLMIDMHLSADKYSPRDSVIVSLELPDDSRGIEVAALSVIKEGTSDTFDGLSDFLMENIFLADPFDFVTEKSNQRLTTAMIIYSNKLAKGDEQISFDASDDEKLWLPDVRDISISGILRDKTTGEPLANVPVISSLLFDQPQIHISRTNNDGDFLFSFYELSGTKEVFVSPLSNENQQEILINNEFALQYPDIADTYRPPDSSHAEFLDELYLNAQINSRFFPQAELQSPASPNIFGDNISYVYPDEYISLPSLQDIFNEIIPYARVRVNKDEVKFAVYNTRTGIWSENPLILLDNAAVTTPEILLDINPAEILKAGILTNTYLTGDQFLPSIILIYTKSGQFGGVEFPGNAIFLEYQMYSPGTEFAAPRYSDPGKKQRNTPDFRNTLYWDPALQIQGDKKVIFYASDHFSDYKILVRGMTADGSPIFGKAGFSVGKPTEL